MRAIHCLHSPVSKELTPRNHAFRFSALHATRNRRTRFQWKPHNVANPACRPYGT